MKEDKDIALMDFAEYQSFLKWKVYSILESMLATT